MLCCFSFFRVCLVNVDGGKKSSNLWGATEPGPLSFPIEHLHEVI